MNVLLKEEKWLLLKGNKSKYDWAKTNKEKSKSAEGVRGQSTDYGRIPNSFSPNSYPNSKYKLL